VEGDLAELDPETLARLRGAIAQTDMSVDDYRTWLQGTGVPSVVYLANTKHHAAKQEAQTRLRAAMAQFGGHFRAKGHEDREIQRAFFLLFGVDVATAMALPRAEAETLADKVAAYDPR